MILIISVIIFLAVVPAIFYPFVAIIMNIHGAIALIGSYFLTQSSVSLIFAFVAFEMYIGISSLIKK